MFTVRMLPDATGVHLPVADRWYVSNGATAVGPVKLDLLARGIEAGKVPLESFVRHEEWKVWRPLAEIAVIEDDAEPTRSQREPLSDDITEPARPTSPDEITAADALAGASDVRDAMLLFMHAAVLRCGADGALVHHVEDSGATAVCAHGPSMFEVLGHRTRLLDPVIVSAAAGNPVIAEPTPGAAGSVLLDRQARLGVAAEGAFSMPIRPRDRLFAVLELGRRTPFRASDIAIAEALAEALACKIEANGWS